MIQSQTESEVARAAELTRTYFQTHAPVMKDVAVLLSVIEALMGASGAVVEALTDRIQAEMTPPAEEPAPVSPDEVRRSITPDALISFIDGNPYKLLKRHLTAHGLTPERYRERFGLPADYPMAAPNYAAKRSEIARSIGLGRYGSRVAPERARRAASH